MNISQTTSNGLMLISLSGRLDAENAPTVERELSSAPQQHKGQRLVLNLEALEYISSAGLRVLLNIARQAQKAGMPFVLAAPTPQVKQVLDMVGFNKIIPLFETVDTACASLKTEFPAAPHPTAPLTVAEELYLLALDEEGLTRPMPTFALDYALAGALLMELALSGYIDSDTESLKPTSKNTGLSDALLADTRNEIKQQTEPHPIGFWLKQLADESKSIEKRVLASLCEKGMLKQQDRRVLWLFKSHRYPITDDRDVKEVRTRLRELVASDEIPTPRDVVLLSLAKACHLVKDLFGADDYEKLAPRINTLTQLDLIGKEMVEAVRMIECTMASLSMPVM